MRMTTGLAITAAALLVIGCGTGTAASTATSDEPAPTTAAVPSTTAATPVALAPCDLLTTDEVAATLDEAVVGVTTDTELDGTTCTYTTASYIATVTVYVGIFVYDQLKENIALGSPVVEVALGDEAFAGDGGLYVLAAGYALGFGIGGPITDPGPREQALARAALERIPARAS